MLDALQAVGRPVERYLDRDALAAQAAVAVAKGLPKALSWLHWAALPEVRWADSGAPVALTTVQWLTAQAVRAKTPEPNAVLRKYCGMFEARSREAFGQYLLEAWLAEDVRLVDPQAAMLKATQPGAGSAPVDAGATAGVRRAPAARADGRADDRRLPSGVPARACRVRHRREGCSRRGRRVRG